MSERKYYPMPNIKNKDLLLIGVPLRELNYPPLSLALLKSVLFNADYDVSIADANLDFYKHCGSKQDRWLAKTFYINNLQPRAYKEIDESEFGQWVRPYLKN